MSQKRATEARRAVNDLKRIERIGRNESIRVSNRIIRTSIRAFRQGEIPNLNAEIFNSELPELLKKGLFSGHLRGLRRGQLIQRRSIKFDALDDALGTLNRLVEADIDALSIQYETQAFKALQTASDGINKQISARISELVAEGVPTQVGVKELRKKFSKLGFTSQSDFLLETIFRTQSGIAYGAGRWQADDDPTIREILWGYEYVTAGDTRVRDSHAELDGLRFPREDPFWNSFFPPNGYNCRCQPIPIFKDEPEAKTSQLPVDVEPDPGFNFNPGTLFVS